jgi:hypothetical protein
MLLRPFYHHVPLGGGALDPCQKAHASAPAGADATLTGLVARYRAADLALANGAVVASWSDASGNGHTASRTQSGDNLPTLVTAPNGAKAQAVRFGASEGLDIPLLSVTSASYGFLAVCRGDLTAQGAKTLLSAQSVHGGFSVQPDRAGDLLLGAIENIGGTATVSAAATCKPQVIIFTADSAGSQLRIYRNGVRLSQAAYTSQAEAFTSWLIGSFDQFSTGWTGDVWELQIANAAVSDAQALSVSNTLIARYGLPS